MGATRKKEARTTKDNMAKDSNVRAKRFGASNKGQDPVEEHCCSSHMSHWGRRGYVNKCEASGTSLDMSTFSNCEISQESPTLDSNPSAPACACLRACVARACG